MISLFKTPTETTSKAEEPRIEFPEFKLALTKAEMCNLLIALSYTCFTEGVHSGRTFAEVYEYHESLGYTQSFILTPKLAMSYRLYAT